MSSDLHRSSIVDLEREGRKRGKAKETFASIQIAFRGDLDHQTICLATINTE